MEESVLDKYDGNDFKTSMEQYPYLRLGHLRLFKAELLRAVESKEDLQKFRPFLGEAVTEKLESCWEKDKSSTIDDFWYCLGDSLHAMNTLFDMACEKDDKLKEMVFTKMSSSSFQFYRRLFSEQSTLMEMITDTLDPLSICDGLKDNEYKAVKDVVQEMMKEKKYDEASCYLMRTLPYVSKLGCEPSDWYFDFLNACNGHPGNRSIPQFIDRNYKTELEAFNTQKQVIKAAKACNGLSDDKSVLPAAVDETEVLEVRACRLQKDYEFFRAKNLSEEAKEMIEDPLPVELRPYQIELVDTASRGVNTIICAPTGSGKTVVAAYIILEHFRRQLSLNKPYRVAMLVPTVPLVEQQCVMLNTYLRKAFWIEGMSGSEPVDEHGRAPYVLSSDVTLFTPQIFINLLKNVRRDDRLYFTDFTLFILDECHHCDGDHPYHTLMRMLHDYNGPKPQIVGLTASLPVGAGRVNVDAALDHMMDLCARLSAHSVSTVRKHLDNLRYHVRPPVDEVKRARRPKKDMFASAMHQCMMKIEMVLKPAIMKLRESKTIDLREDEVNFPCHESSTRYESFVGSLKNRVSEMRGSPTKHNLIKMLEHLGYYYRALCLSDMLPNQYALRYLNGKMANEVVANVENNNVVKQLQEMFRTTLKDLSICKTEDDITDGKEIIKLLHDTLREQYRKEERSRTIIFVTTRLMAQYLTDHLNTVRVVDDTSRAVGFVTSSNQSTTLHGQTADEQRVMIDGFNLGVIKVLVATSVAEEGLDISACNLIIKYNNTGSERSLIQRRGRARARNSKSILLALDGAIEERELESIQKEHLMRRCLEHMQTKTEEQMKLLVEAKMAQQKVLRDAVLAQNKERKSLLTGKCYNLVCRLCGAFICKSSDIRLSCDSQYVCCDPRIWSRIDARVYSAKSFAIATLVGKPHCKGSNGVECSEVLGTIVKLYGAFLPSFSARALTLDADEGIGRAQKEKKWDALARDKFNIEPITDTDLMVMYDSLYKYSHEQHLTFEAEAKLAIERAIKEMKKEKKRRFTIEE